MKREEKHTWRGSRRWTRLSTRSHRNRGSQRKRNKLEKRRLRENTILDNQSNRKELITRRRIFRSVVGADIASREGERVEDCRKATEEERQVPETHLDYMPMVNEKKVRTMAVARERATRAALSTVVPRESTGEWRRRMLMAWLREMGLEFVDIIVKSDNVPALTSFTGFEQCRVDRR